MFPQVMEVSFSASLAMPSYVVIPTIESWTQLDHTELIERLYRDAQSVRNKCPQ